jgi:S1-C subfamily serine protease
VDFFLKSIPALLLLSATVRAGHIDTESLFQKASPSIVLIEATSKDDKESFGTGFVIKGGYIATNHHVIEGAKYVDAKTQSGERFPISGMIADDDYRDIAILCPAVPSLKPLDLGDSEKVHAGTDVAVIGNPEGFENTITEGLISGIRNIDDYNQIFQFSAPISKGSSGSPVFNTNNEVIGMVSSFLEHGQLINFAIPSNQILDLLKRSKYSPPPKASYIDPKLGFELLEGAKRNDPKSEYLIGLIYGKDKNYSIALQWFKMAAEKNYYPAEEMLGYFYMNGVGVTASAKKAKYWFTQSINHGNTKLQN